MSTNSRKTALAVAQMGPIHLADTRAAVVKRLIELLREAKSRSADMVVFPELALTTFFPRYWMSEEEAVERANQTPFGLGSYVMTTDKEQGERVADKIEAGMVFVNVVGADSPELPFGGVKRSGFGRELGRFGADEFVNKKLIRSA